MPKQILVNENQVITGFCYNYFVALLEKFDQLMVENKVFSEPGPVVNDKTTTTLQPLAEAILIHLYQQVFQNSPGGYFEDFTEEKILNFIKMTRQFVQIFEKKE